MTTFLRSRVALICFGGAALTAFGCSLITDFDESRIPAEPGSDVGVDAVSDSASPLDTAMPDTAMPMDTADTATTDTAMPMDTADTATTDTAMPMDTATTDTATTDTATTDTATTDTATTDTTTTDTATTDTATTDTATTDTGVTDSGSADTSDGGPTLSFATDIQPIFNTHCTGCHSGSGSGGLSLAAGSAHANLVNVTTTCDGTSKRVVPFDKMASQLWLKTANHSTKCMAAMPNGTMGLIVTAPADFAKLEKWIEEGALDN